MDIYNETRFEKGRTSYFIPVFIEDGIKKKKVPVMCVNQIKLETPT